MWYAQHDSPEQLTGRERHSLSLVGLYRNLTNMSLRQLFLQDVLEEAEHCRSHAAIIAEVAALLRARDGALALPVPAPACGRGGGGRGCCCAATATTTAADDNNSGSNHCS